MAMFNSVSWTGAKEDAVVAEKPRLPNAPTKLRPRIDTAVMPETAVAEYRRLAKEIGISDRDMMVEEFRLFLAKHDIPTFNLQEVVAYMDEISAKDNPTGCGWQWCPVRPKDGEIALTFGRQSEDRRRFSSGEGIIPASDFYESHRFRDWHQGGGGWHGGIVFSSRHSSHSGNQHVVNVESNLRLMQEAHDEPFQQPPTPRDWRQEPSPAYTRTLPLHALKKIALIERELKVGKPIFLVTDYVTAPHVIVNPDPFLMAVIPNSAVAHGKGRFIIDVWDEPGFGIDRMVK